MPTLFTSSRSSSKTRWVPGHRDADSEADLLPKPAHGGGPPSPRGGVWLTRRYTKLAVASLVGLALVWTAVSLRAHWRRSESVPVPQDEVEDGPPVVLPATVLATDVRPDVNATQYERMPPDYARFHEYELQTSARSGDSADTKYMFIASHQRNCGWGNVMQELLLNALLAYRMGRTFVYYNYTWRDDGSQYTLFNGKHVPSTIPLSALLQGPVLGAPPTTDRARAPQPFAVTEDHFHRVCPPGARTVVRADAVTAALAPTTPVTAGGVLAQWVERFGALPDRCLEVPRDGGQNFDIYMFGDASRLLDIWPALSESPLLREFAWSPLVERAFDRNRAVFAPASAVRPLTGPGSSSSGARPAKSGSGSGSPSAARYAPLAGLLALHVRRGDFAEHCANLARWGSSYVAYNAFSGMPDTFRFPLSADGGADGGADGSAEDAEDAAADARVEMQRPHCFPGIPEIVARAVEERERARGGDGGAGLVDVYVMTNGPGEWVRELKDALWAAGGWRSVATSRDLDLDWEQRFVKQAVDMLIGQRAQVFVGNGFSSLSGLVNMLRTANGIPAAQNRLF